jgi:hypothetical protein
MEEPKQSKKIEIKKEKMEENFSEIASYLDKKLLSIKGIMKIKGIFWFFY